MSRRPLNKDKKIDTEVAGVQAKFVAECIVYASAVKQQTRKDAKLSKVAEFVLRGCPASCPNKKFQLNWN